MKAFYSIIALLITIFMSGCTKVETISVDCGANNLNPSTNNISTDYFTNTSVKFDDKFSEYDTLEVIFPSGAKRQFVFYSSITNGYTYQFSTISSVYAGLYTFTHKYATSRKCNTKTSTVRLTLTGNNTNPCQIAQTNLVYFIGSSSTYPVSYYNYYPNFYFNYYNPNVYHIEYTGSYHLNFFFFGNQKPKPGDVFTVGVPSYRAGLATEVNVSFGSGYSSTGNVFCITENNKTYLSFCNLDLNGSYYSAKVELP